MILRNVSKYCRPLTSVCEAQPESDSERFALQVHAVYTLSVVKESSLCMVWLHVVPLSLLQLDSVCFQRWNKIPNYKIMSLLLKRTMTKNVKKKWDAHRWVWISCFLLSCMYVRKTSTWFLNCGTPNKLHVKTIKSSVWLKWNPLCLSVRRVHVHTVLVLQLFERLPTSKSLFSLDLRSPEHREISTATHSQGTIYPDVNWILLKKNLNVVSFTHLL